MKLKNNWLLILILIFAAVLMSQTIIFPCGRGHLGYGCNFHTNIAENYLKYGFLKTKLGPVVEKESSGFVYYIHHPALIFYLLLGLVFKVIGPWTWSARLIPLFFSLLNIVLIYLLTKEMFKKETAYIASFFASLAPILIVYGIHIAVIGSLALSFILITFFFYFKWTKENKKSYYYLMLISFFIGTQAGWPIYFLIPALVLHNIIINRKIRKEILILVLIAILAFGLYLCYVKLLTGSFLGGPSYEGSLLWALKVRSSNIATDSDHSLRFTAGEFLLKSGKTISRMFTAPLMLLSAVWVIWSFIKILKRKLTREDLYILMLFLFPLIFILILKQAAFIHGFLFIFFLPGIAISSAVIFGRIPSRLKVWALILLIIFISFGSLKTSFQILNSSYYGFYENAVTFFEKL